MSERKFQQVVLGVSILNTDHKFQFCVMQLRDIRHKHTWHSCLYVIYIFISPFREANATYTPASGGTSVHIGFPLKQAVWRTNHGYDPVIRQHFEWSQAPNSWSMQRYMFIHDAFTTYEREDVKIGKESLKVRSL